MANIGFIGLGIMGRPMAEHLIAGGHTLHVSSHHKAPDAELLAKAITVHPTPKAVAAASEMREMSPSHTGVHSC